MTTSSRSSRLRSPHIISAAAVVLTFGSAAFADGTVAWRFPLAGPYALHTGAVATDGTVYVQDVLGVLYALSPTGHLRWTYDTGGLAEGPVAIGPDGTIYASGNPAGPDVSIHAVNPDGTRRWIFTDPGVTQGIIAGPAVGPDGNIYAVTESPGLGAFSVSALTGQLRWSSGDALLLNERGQTGAAISFGPRMPGGTPDQCFVAFDMFGTPATTGQLFAFALDGSRRLQVSIGGDANVGQFQPAAGPATGSIFLSSLASTQGYRLRSFSADGGGAMWSYPADTGAPTNYLTQPTVGPDGTIYIMRNLGQIHAVTQGGNNRWIHATSFVFDAPVASPANDVVVVGGILTYGQPGFVKGLAVADGSLLWTINLPDEAGVHMVPYSRPWFSPGGRRAYITTTLPGSSAGAYLYAIDLLSPSCAADFNGDGQASLQDLFDFLGAYFTGSTLADVNDVGGVTIQDIFDFLAAYFAGCP